MFIHSSFHILRTILQEGSFTKAAQKLDMSGAAVGKHVQILESKMKLRLFHRTTRKITPTDAAIKISAAVRQSEEHLNGVLEELAQEQSMPTGRLKINVPMSYGELFLAKPMAKFASAYPDVIVDVDFDDKRVHLIEEGYDLVIRIGILEDSGLIAKRISDFPILMCASPKLVQKLGKPKTPKDLSNWPFICYSNATHPSLWSYKTDTEESSSVNLRPSLYANSASMMKEACIEGVGAALLPQFSCETEIMSGDLIHILPEYKTAPERGVYVIYPNKKFMPLKVRKFIDMLQQN
jgi:DNA-binding transcriptional LysR family regulator